jgi:hypothetical protein
MFGFFKKKRKTVPVPALEDRLSGEFLALVDSIDQMPSADDRLIAFTRIWSERLSTETAMALVSKDDEMFYLRDYLDDAFEKCGNPDVIIECAGAMDRASRGGKAFNSVQDFQTLPAHMQLRLAQLHVDKHVRLRNHHSSEFEPRLQAVFVELEERDASTSEIKEFLRKEHGIDWKSFREMNPHIIVEPVFSG